MRRVEKVKLQFLRSVVERMQSAQVHRSELARRMKVSPEYVTKTLNNPPNLTIETMVKIADALHMNVSVELVRKY